MKNISLFIIAILLFAAGWFGHDYFSEGNIKIVRVEKPVYKWIVDPEHATCKQALGCLRFPIAIDTQMINQDILEIYAYDNCKETRKSLHLKCAANDAWQMYVAIGAVSLAAGVLGVLFLK